MIGILDNLVLKPMPVCESCIEGKMTKRSFPHKGNRSSELLESVHTDVYGPINLELMVAPSILSYLLMTTLDTDIFT